MPTSATVSNGQTSTGLSVSSGETLTVNSGGKILSTQVANGGVVNILSGGADSATTLSAGGVETVNSGGSATGDLIYGTMNVISTGATAIANETVEAGGVLTISKAATAVNTIMSGGTVDLLTGAATVGGTLTMAVGTSNTLNVTSVTNALGADGDTAAIIGFAAGDKIDFLAATSAAVTLSQVVSGGNTVAEIISGGVNIEQFIFSGTAISGSLGLAADANGHAEIVYVSASAPTGTTTSVTTSTASGAYTETSGNTLLVLGGGSVSAATISSGGFLTVNGGADTAAVISSGGVETISAGTASNDVIAGGATVDSGASVTSETVVGGGSLVIATGGSDLDAVISAGGSATVGGATATGDEIYGTLNTVSANAGVLTGETVEAGGVVTLANGNTASNTTVLSGGVFNISGANLAATGIVLSGGGVVDLASPKAQIDGVITFAGGGNTLEVSSMTSAGYGDQAVISGFSTTDKIDVTAIAVAGASLNVVTSGGNEVATLTNGSNSEAFIFAGTSTYTGFTLGLASDAGGDAEIVYNPNAVTLTVSSGVTSTGLNITSGETLTVLSGGVVSATKVQGGGALVVSGTDHSATISASGVETIYGSASGDQVAGTVTVDGAATGETVLAGGSLVVNGGLESSATVFAGGTEAVTNSGAASGDQIYGSVTVSGASVSGETVQGGGALAISAGVDSGSTILAGGNELILGSATGDQIYGVQLVSAATAVVTSETVYAGGAIDVFLKGGVASGTVVSSGGALNISGNAYASNTTLSGGGLLDLESPKAEVTGALVFAGGGNTLEISDLTSAGYGTSAVISGFSSTDKIDITSGAYVGGALTLSQTISGANTVATVISGGATVETFVFAGTSLDGHLGLLSDNAGGVDLEIPPVSVTTSVTTSTASGAYSETATNTLLVLNGGSISAAAIDAGGFLVVNGGADSAATIFAGGTETISAGSASGDQIFGSAIVAGGVVSGEVVQSGGLLDIAAGASASNISLSGHGAIDMASPSATLTGSVTFAGGFNTLQAGAVAASGAGDQAVISGFSSADKIDVSGISPTGAALSFSTNAAGDSVATISGAAGSESFLFNSPATYNAGSMSLISDGAGGVDLILDTVPVVAFTSLGLQTNAATQIVNGTVNTTLDPEAIGTTVSVTEGDTVVGTGVVGANGQWSADVTFANTDGANVLSASDTDVAGEKGVTSQSVTYNVNTTAAAFIPGNLVVSISGDGDGSGQYGDNQASPITLEQITTNGSLVSQLVLPQITTVVNGVTEYAISGEYGSSSEGSLQLSADGHSLVIAGYGVNDQVFNSGGAAVYGTAALAQSTSIQGGAYTPVARVVADINADGVVDTSTALYNIYNLNNPRSVATVNGSSFWLSGQGVKGDTTQGVFYATDGASSATGINDATDTRTAVIYDGQLYVSADSTQGATTIENYGGLPTSTTTPTTLQGLSGSVVLTSATANTVNTADIGSSVNLSPENFFFANADTLYVADGGDPKEGGLGDGGLQKWIFNGTKWTLEYTLSAGLNLVPDTASSGTSGLIGLTGKVVGDTVQLYATNETLTDLGQTYVYAITDQLNSTTGSGESFTAIMAATPGENIRGISFAPTACAPTITGTVAGQTTIADAAVTPFQGVTIADQNAQATETLTITVGGSGGALSGAGLSGGAGGVYTLSGTAAAVTAQLDALSFSPTGAPAAASTSTFTLSDLSSANTTPTVDTTTTVIDTDPPAAPAITSLVGQPVNGSAIEVSGTGTAGETVTLFADGGSTAVGSGVVGANGVFDIITSSTFADGDHTLTATQTDAANLTSTASTSFAVAVDPAAPAVTGVVGQPVNGSAIEVTGTGAAGDTITLYADGGSTAVGTGVVGSNGLFDITTSVTFGDGPHAIAATQTDTAGLSSAVSPGLAVSVNPETPVITTLVGQPTAGSTIEVQGVGEAGDTITLYADGGSTAVGSGVVGANGAFDITTTATFADGLHTLTATQTDGSNLTGGASNSFQVAITPPTPALTALVGTVYGPYTIEVQGVGQSGDTVQVIDENPSSPSQYTVIGTGVVGANGDFDIKTNTTLTYNGVSAANLAVLQTDSSGVSSAISPSDLVQVHAQQYILSPLAETLSAINGAADVYVNAPTDLNPNDVINLSGASANPKLVLTGGVGGTYDLRIPSVLSGVAVIDVLAGQAASGSDASTREVIDLRAGMSASIEVTGERDDPTNPNPVGITINGANDSDIINLQIGADTVTLGSANETVNGGAGFDTVYATAANAGAKLKAGAGGMSLEITSGGGAVLNASDKGFNVKLDQATNLTLAKGVTNVVGSAGNDTFVLNSGNLIATADYDGGGGTNTLAFNGAGTFNLNKIGALANFQVVDVTAGQTVTLRSGTNVTVDVLESAGPGAAIIGGADSDTINLGAGADTFTLGSATETVNGGAGAGTVVAKAAANAGALLTGGAGGLTLDVTAGGVVTMNAGDSGVGAIDLTASASAYTVTTNAEAGLLVDELGTGKATITLGGAGQTVIGGAGKLTVVEATAGGDTLRDTSAAITKDAVQGFAAGDVIDVTDMNEAKLTATFVQSKTAPSGILTLSDGTHSASITLFGQFAAAGFTGSAASVGFSAAVDGSGGTDITYAMVSASHSNAVSQSLNPGRSNA